jgi:uncharacterized protein YndB with AHSA1/START domain
MAELSYHLEFDPRMLQRFVDTVVINAPAQVVWENLTRIESMREWMGEPEMMIEVETNWNVGAPIVVRGFHHIRFESTGVVLKFEPRKTLSYTHLSSLSRLPDQPQSYTTFEFILEPVGQHTSLTMVATNFPTPTIFKHVQFYWTGTLGILKQYSELHGPGGS